MPWSKQQLDEEIDYEQFLKELEWLKAWISKQPRRRSSWLYSVAQWANGDH